MSDFILHKGNRGELGRYGGDHWSANTSRFFFLLLIYTSIATIWGKAALITVIRACEMSLQRLEKLGWGRKVNFICFILLNVQQHNVRHNLRLGNWNLNVTFVVNLTKTCVEYVTSQLLKCISKDMVLTKWHKNIAEILLWWGVYAVKS